MGGALSLISTSIELESSQAAISLLTELVGRLSKYGEVKSVIFEPSDLQRNKTYIVEQGSKAITIYCEHLYSRPDLYINYYDREVCSDAEAEMELEKKKNSGLDNL